MIELKILNPKILEFGMPTTETAGAAGYDLRACIEAPIVVLPESMCKVPTGISIHMGDRGLAGFLMPRSGLAAKYQITLQNAVGLIDSDYQGEIHVLIRNEGREPYRINPGDRIAQLVFVPVVYPILAVVSEFVPSDRGTGGFGSTGVESRPLSQGYVEPSDSGMAFPAQLVGNDEQLIPGAVSSIVPIYEPTGQELLEAEYGADDDELI